MKLFSFGLILFQLIVCTAIPDAFSFDKSGVKSHVISLPEGPGSIEGLGSEFEVQLNTGTGNFSVPINVPKAKIQPQLNLTYTGGTGNGILGIGWILDLPYIQKDLQEGVPKYDESDTFHSSLSGALLDIGDGVYRSKTEQLFIRYEKLSDGWMSTAKDGTRYEFGITSGARIDFAEGTFQWALERREDTYGNGVNYSYILYNNQIYPDVIRYGGVDEDYFEIYFIYNMRSDAFASYLSGHRIETTQRLEGILIYGDGRLIRRYDFDYSISSSQLYSLLSKVTLIGNDGFSSYPPLTFEYTSFTPDVRPIETITNPPALDLKDPDVEILDFNGDGLPDLMTTEEKGISRFYENLGLGEFAGGVQLPSSPVDISDPKMRFADMDGNALVDLVAKGIGASEFKYYPNYGQYQWDAAITFPDNPSFSFEKQDGSGKPDPNVRLMDINHDKKIDVMVTHTDYYEYYMNLGEDGWERVIGDDLGGQILFENPRVQLAEMNGDGLMDIVYFWGKGASLQIKYWPNKGNGEWDEAEFMDNPPNIMNPDEKLFFCDINDDGLSDIVCIEYDWIHYWINMGDGSFGEELAINDTPLYTTNTALRFADINGNGSKDILWGNPGSMGGYQYLDLTGGVSPNLISTIENGLGKRIDLSYSQSISFYIEQLRSAREKSEDDPNKLPFSVPVISQLIVSDGLGNEMTTTYEYFDGYYDATTREFRGFERALETKLGDESAPSQIRRYGYDTGRIQGALKGMPLLTEYLDEADVLYLREENSWEVRSIVTTVEEDSVDFPALVGRRELIYEGTDTPGILEKEFDYDEFGNRIAELDYGEVFGDDFGYGNDEKLTFTEYAVNEDAWIVDRPYRIYQEDLFGEKLSEELYYYDGESFVGLGPGELGVHGALMRIEVWVGPFGGEEYQNVESKSYDSWGNSIEIMNGNGNLRERDYDYVLHTYPTAERIYPEEGRSLEISAIHDLARGLLIDYLDWNGHLTRYDYDPFGRLTKIIKPGDSFQYPAVRYTYMMGEPITSIKKELREKRGQPDTFDEFSYYDGLGRLRQKIIEGPSSNYILEKGVTFNSLSLEQEKYYPYFSSTYEYEPLIVGERKKSYKYDCMGRRVRTDFPDGTFELTAYFPLRRTVYDEEDNNPASTHYNTPKTYYYDGQQRTIEVQRIDNGVISASHFEWNSFDQITSLLDPEGNLKELIYDNLGQLRQINDPNTGIITLDYDGDSNPILRTDARGKEIIYCYDGVNRLTGENYVEFIGDSDFDVIYHYDEPSDDHPDLTNTAGRLSWVEDQSGIEYNSYDDRGNVIEQVKSLDGKVFSTSFQYDSMNRMTELKYYDDTSISYVYNPGGMVESIGGFVNNIEYGASGEITSLRFANGVLSNYVFDEKVRLTGIHTEHGDGSLQDLSFVLDGVGNPLSIVDHLHPSGIRSDSLDITYDDLYRMVSATTGEETLDLTYDSAHNIETKLSSDLSSAFHVGDFEYGERAGPYAVTTAGTQQYGYDASGNMIERNGDDYIYDHKGRLSEIIREGSTLAEYNYNYEDIRTRKVVHSGPNQGITYYINQYQSLSGGFLTKYVFLGDQRIGQWWFEPGGCGIDITEKTGIIFLLLYIGIVLAPLYFYSLHKRLKVRRSDNLPNKITRSLFIVSLCFIFVVTNSQIAEAFGKGIERIIAGSTERKLFYHLDHIGSINIVTDEIGTAVEEIHYYPFGQIRYDEGTANVRFKYTGQEYDEESGLYYFKKRYYDPMIGKFISPDLLFVESPVTALERQRLGELNVYSYALNNPLTYIDPSGEFILEAMAALITVTVIGIIKAVKAIKNIIGYIKDRVKTRIEELKEEFNEWLTDKIGEIQEAIREAIGEKIREKVGEKIREKIREKIEERMEEAFGDIEEEFLGEINIPEEEEVEEEDNEPGANIPNVPFSCKGRGCVKIFKK